MVSRDDQIAFVRLTPDGAVKRHGEVGLAQAIERDIRDYQRLHLIIKLRVVQQSLSGGGQAGTEYPLMVRVVYLDGAGREQIWTKGFYYQNENNLNTKLGDQIPRDTWVTYDNPNLLQEMRPAPVALTRIEIIGSGWEYESGVRRVELTGA
ncbi:MAG: hypothetical protein FJ029_12465 [Actinobacteria bacterium]|nr:hypothetical protein [Actinomycetota bacterium]